MRKVMKRTLIVALGFQLMSVAAVAGGVLVADSVGWDDFLLVSARKSLEVGRWQVCPDGAIFADSRRGSGCVRRAALIGDTLPSKIKTLQQIVDERAKRIPGYKNVAVGPMPVYYYSNNSGWKSNAEIHVAYRHVPLSMAERAEQLKEGSR